MAEDAPTESGPADSRGPAAPSDPGERAGVFERYALIAALTVVVLCLLVWDRWRDRASDTAAPGPDRALHVELGGEDPNSTAPPPARAPSADAPGAGAATPPPAPPKPAPAPEPRTYVVQSGDTLYDIARRELGASSRMQEIADLNGLADPSRLRAGQSLKLPAR